jgi:WD40 repeat protein
MTLRLPNRIAENIANFTGRTWLLPQLLEWFEQTSDRMFILQGEPGTGKSMIAAWLAGAGREPTDVEATFQLKQIRSQVMAVHFCIEASGSIAPKSFAQNIAEQLTRNVEGFGDALATTLDDQVKIIGEVNAGQIEAGGSATGVHIERLDLGALSDELSFDRVFRAPLNKLYETGFGAPMILLIDALDEAATYTGSSTIVRLLARLTDLPDSVRILVTTRSDPRVLKHYRKVTPFDLIEDAPDNEEDVRLYAFERLAELDRELRNKLADRITQGAEGNFLYTHLVLDDLLIRKPDIPDLDALTLPKGLSGLYHDFLNRELGYDEDRWYNYFKPVLGLVAVAQGDGLFHTQIASIIGKEVEQSLRICKQYLDGNFPDGPFRHFHRSFADFLLEDEENIDYHIDAASMHRQVADYYLSQYADKWFECDEYGLRELPAHLIGAGLVEEMRGLLCDFNWLSAKLEATDVNALISDYDFLIGDPAGHRIQNSIRLSAHVLAQDNSQLAGQLVGRLMTAENPKVLELLDQAMQWKAASWLRPLMPTLTAPGGPLLFTLKGHTEMVNTVAVTEDGHFAVSGAGSNYSTTTSTDNTLKVWDLESGSALRTLHGHTGHVLAVQIVEATSGRLVISASGDQTVKVWDLESGTECRTLWVDNALSAMAATPDGQSVLVATTLKAASSGHEDCILSVRDLETGAERFALHGHMGKINAITVTPDGLYAISASSDHSLIVWDLENESMLYRLEGHADPVTAVAVTPDRRRLVSGSSEFFSKFGTIKVWDLESGKNLATLKGHRSAVQALAVTPDGRYAIVAPPYQESYVSIHDRILKMWDLETDVERLTLCDHERWVNAIAITPDGQCAISASMDHTLKVWNLNSEADERLFQPHPDEITAVAITPDGKRVLSGSGHIYNPCEIKIWDLEQIREVGSLKGHERRVTQIEVTRSGRYAVSASYDQTVKVWDLETDTEVVSLGRHSTYVNAVAVAPDEQQIVSASGWGLAGDVYVWDIRSERQLLKFLGSNVFGLAITPDGQRAIAGTVDGYLYVWEIQSGKEVAILGGHSNKVTSVALTSDGRSAVSGAVDGTVKLWDIRSGQDPLELLLNKHPELAVKLFLFDEKMEEKERLKLRQELLENLPEFFTKNAFQKALQKNTLYLKESRSLTGHTGGIHSVDIAPDGQRAVSASDDHTLKIWDTQTGLCIATFSGESPLLSCALAPDGVTIIAGDNTGRLHILRLEGE